MAYEFVRVDPQTVRSDVVNFFWHHRHWPWSSLQEYYAAWDWRYTSLSDGNSWVWLARKKESGEIAGHIAVYMRRFQIDGCELRVGVPGNLLVAPDARGTLIGPRLVSFPRSLVKTDELDMVLAFANPSAHAMFQRLGFRDLGLMHPFIQVRNWKAVLSRRLPAAAPLGVLIGHAAAAARRSRLKTRASNAPELRIRRLTPEEFLSFDRSHWRRRSDQLSTADSGAFIVRRYLECPYARRHLVGLIDGDTQSLEGYMVAGGEGRVRIWDCQVNPDSLDEGEAIERLGAVIPSLETIEVPTLPGSQLAKRLSEAGFRRRDPDNYMSQSTHISAYWSDTHAAAATLAKAEAWNLWFGANHY